VYTSPYLHHTLLEDLPTATTIYYKVGGSQSGYSGAYCRRRGGRELTDVCWPVSMGRARVSADVTPGALRVACTRCGAGVMNFTTGPGPALRKGASSTFVIIGDLGQTSNSQDTLDHIIAGPITKFTGMWMPGDLRCVLRGDAKCCSLRVRGGVGGVRPPTSNLSL
jgi:hypothetical protein